MDENRLHSTNHPHPHHPHPYHPHPHPHQKEEKKEQDEQEEQEEQKQEHEQEEQEEQEQKQDQEQDQDQDQTQVNVTKGWQFWLIFTCLVITALMSSLEGSIVATALPTISANLHAAENYIWVVNAYFLSA